MHRHINRAGQTFIMTMFKYYAPLALNVIVPDTYNCTKLFGLWEKKGSELELNMMRYIHGKYWYTKLLEILIAK